MSKEDKTILIVAIVGMIAASIFIGVFPITAADASGGLKIVVKFQYPDYLKKHPSQIGKMVLNAYSDTDEYQKQIKMSKLPKSTTFEMDVPVNGEFTVHLNSYARDDGTQVSGVNGPEREPETVRLRVP